jgi:hypothetical protein
MPMPVRRSLLLGGTAVVAMLWTTSAAALPAPPAVPVVPLPSRPALGVAPVDDAVGYVPAPGSATPTLPIPKVVDLPHAGDPPPKVVPPLAVSPLPSAPLPAGSRPALPSDQQRVDASAGAMPPPAAHARNDGVATGRRPDGLEGERGTGAPVVNRAVAEVRSIGVRGALDARSKAEPWSSLGTAATSLALWGALCALALLARGIVLSAWRDASRRRRALSLR